MQFSLSKPTGEKSKAPKKSKYLADLAKKVSEAGERKGNFFTPTDMDDGKSVFFFLGDYLEKGEKDAKDRAGDGFTAKFYQMDAAIHFDKDFNVIEVKRSLTDSEGKTHKVQFPRSEKVIEKELDLLEDEGVEGVIVSNHWVKYKADGSIRYHGYSFTPVTDSSQLEELEEIMDSWKPPKK